MIRLKVDVCGATVDEAWDNLLTLVCQACEDKQKDRRGWPLMISIGGAGGNRGRIDAITETEPCKANS